MAFFFLRFLDDFDTFNLDVDPAVWVRLPARLFQRSAWRYSDGNWVVFASE